MILNFFLHAKHHRTFKFILAFIGTFTLIACSLLFLTLILEIILVFLPS
jgi:hypothetical protein